MMLRPRSLSPQKTLRQFEKPSILDYDEESSKLSRARSFRQTLLNSVFERSMVSESSAAHISFSDSEEIEPYEHMGFHECMTFSPQERTIDWKYLASEVLCPSIFFSKALRKLQVQKQQNMKQKQHLLPIAHFQNTRKRVGSVSRFAAQKTRPTLAFQSTQTKGHKKLLIKAANQNLGRRGAALIAPLAPSLHRSSVTNMKYNKKILELQTDIEDLEDEHSQAVKDFKLLSKNAQKLLNHVSGNESQIQVTKRSRANSHGRVTPIPSISISSASTSRLLAKGKQKQSKKCRNSSFFQHTRKKSCSVKSTSTFINSRKEIKQMRGKDDDQTEQPSNLDCFVKDNSRFQNSTHLSKTLNATNWRINMKVLPKINSTKYDKLLKYHADTSKEVKRHKSSKILALINSHQKGLIYKMVSQMPRTYIISKKCYKKQATHQAHHSQFWMSNYISPFGKSEIQQ